MRNLLFQYYIPYEANDSHFGGVEMPRWAQLGERSARAYAKYCGAEYLLSHDRYFPHLDPRLDSLRLFYDPFFDQFDHILCLDLDMLIRTKENAFDLNIADVAMVHEVGVHNNQGKWLHNVMHVPGHERGVIAYGKRLFGSDWMFPKSKLYPREPWRYLNGGFQLWTKRGRLKARKNFTSVDEYYMHTRYTEQMYINLQLSQPIFEVTELDNSWNKLSSFQRLDGKINHYIGSHKKRMS